ncbi:MAG TPA: 2,3-diphosphoglycerate-dependent phosphoglycerate mutase [Pseudobdellovibrionaceae bacterium]|nr:2,3-diphosphoglycerate-dependent phosphoglycerate mutase [Pseudobdellovibrionaceae bacterium]
MSTLVLVRHGESQWNRENRFTGWVDVDLSETGTREAQQGGLALKEGGFQFDVVYTSVLKRAIHTMDIVLNQLDQVWLPVHKDWRLNERHYGALQGLNKSETAARHGEDQVKIWRRSYDIAPPKMDESDPGHPTKDLRYKHIDSSLLPSCESLKDTVHRFMPLWKNSISKDLLEGKKVLIVAHGNSLRALIQYLDKMTPEQIMEVNMPTGIPLHYELDKDFHVLKKEFIGSPEDVEKAMASVAAQGKSK